MNIMRIITIMHTLWYGTFHHQAGTSLRCAPHQSDFITYQGTRDHPIAHELTKRILQSSPEPCPACGQLAAQHLNGVLQQMKQL